MIFLMLDDLIKLTDHLKSMAHQHDVPVAEYDRLIVRIMDPLDGGLRASIIDIQEENDTKEGNIYASTKS